MPQKAEVLGVQDNSAHGDGNALVSIRWHSRESSKSTDGSTGPLALKSGSKAVFVLQEQKGIVILRSASSQGNKTYCKLIFELHDKHRETSKLKQKGKGIRGLSRYFFPPRSNRERRKQWEETNVCGYCLWHLFLSHQPTVLSCSPLTACQSCRMRAQLHKN